MPIEKLRKGLMDGVRLDVFFPGFPTLKHIAHKATVRSAGVRVFEQASRGENVILNVTEEGRPNARDVAAELIGKEIWVGWPHMVEAKVTGILDETTVFSLGPKGNLREELVDRDSNRSENFWASSKVIAEKYLSRWGINIGKTHVIVQAAPMTGRKVNTDSIL